MMNNENAFSNDALERLRAAFDLYDTKEEERLNAECAKHRDEQTPFSEGFEKRMAKLIRKQSRPRILRKRSFRIAVFAAAVLLLFCSLAFGVTAIRERLFGLFFEEHRNYSKLTFVDESALRERIEEYYMPTYIPEGFSLAGDDIDRDSYFANYTYRYQKEKAYTTVMFSQFSRTGPHNAYEITVSTENAEVKEVEFKGKTALYVYSCSSAAELTSFFHFLAWEEDGYIFNLSLSEYGDQATLFKIAESVTASGK